GAGSGLAVGRSADPGSGGLRAGGAEVGARVDEGGATAQSSRALLPELGPAVRGAAVVAAGAGPEAAVRQAVEGAGAAGADRDGAGAPAVAADPGRADGRPGPGGARGDAVGVGGPHGGVP